jgi:hypothetical protein
VLILRWKVPSYGPRAGVAFIWIFIALVVGIPNAVHRVKKEPYYGRTDYCKVYLIRFVLVSVPT